MLKETGGSMKTAIGVRRSARRSRSTDLEQTLGKPSLRFDGDVIMNDGPPIAGAGVPAMDKVGTDETELFDALHGHDADVRAAL